MVHPRFIHASTQNFQLQKLLTITMDCGKNTCAPQYIGFFRMNCPFCGFVDSKVIDSRDVNEGIRRRRQCLSCNARFTTYERLQPASLFILKKDQRRE